MGNSRQGSLVNASYSSGSYFSDISRHSEDAEFKANAFLHIFLPFAEKHGPPVKSVIDVGCGSGDVIKIISRALTNRSFRLDSVKGYDVSPHVMNLKDEKVKYVYGDFCESDESADLVTLFNVFENVPDPVRFLNLVSERCNLMALLLPLEDCLYNCLRNRFVSGLKSPGHLLYMDLTSALNLLSIAGLRVINYEFAPNFLCVSARKTIPAKIAFPFQYLTAQISPWLLSKITGLSLMVIAVTPNGMRQGIV